MVAPRPGPLFLAAKKNRIHLVINSDRAGDGRPVKIGVIVFLRESEADIGLDQVNGGEA